MLLEDSDFQKILGALNKSKIQRNFKTYEGDIVTDMEKIFSSYSKVLRNFLNKELSASQSSLYHNVLNRINSIDELSNSIVNATKQYLEGDVRQSYNTFSVALDIPEIRNCLASLTKELGQWANVTRPAFRVRTSSSPLLEREQMFHISFSNRHLVKTQRYSVEGLPCLYLGTSLYICWQELGCPDLDKLYISSFRATSEAKGLGILNLAYTLDSLKEKKIIFLFDDDNYGSEDTQVAYLTLWPLVIACSYVKKVKDASFNPEYIIPNLLMQKINSDESMNISGLAYYSTKSEKTSSDAFGVNIVLPPKATYNDMTSYDFCPTLSSNMLLTRPVSWSLLSTLNFENTSQNFITERNIDDIYATLLDSYGSSDFNLLEQNIKTHFKFEKIENKVK
jgi:hypothetical protein